ncbi:MAG: DUF349 domain-containing protein [Candidatus Ancillula sp.]|jgi:hypothetical protein|nr:DUF349 domain-containing protein [Candidatus Ancillula sp.]
MEIRPGEETKFAEAMKFGRVDEDGNVYVVIEGATPAEVRVGQYSNGEIDPEMKFYIRRFIDQVDKMLLFAKRLDFAKDITSAEIDQSLAGFNEFLEKPSAVGNYSALREYVTELTELSQRRKETNTVMRKELIESTFTKLNEIIAKVEAYLSVEVPKNHFRDSQALLDDTFTKWKETKGRVPLPKKESDALWERFVSVREEIYKKRKEFYDSRKQKESEVKSRKDAIIKEAESKKDTMNFDEGKKAFAQFMKDWKAAGSGRRSTDDEQWAKFNALRDYFYNRIPEDSKPQRQERAKWDNNLSELKTEISGLDALQALKKKLEKAGK